MSRFVCLFLLCMPGVLGMGHCFAGPVTSPRGYSLTPPQGWRASTDVKAVSGKAGGDLIVFKIDQTVRFTSSLNVVVRQARPSDPLPTLEAARSYAVKSYPAQFPQWKLLSQRFSSLNGSRDLDTTASCLNASTRRLMRLRQAVVARGRMLFFFTCVSPENAHAKYDKAFDSMLRSVRWTTGG